MVHRRRVREDEEPSANLRLHDLDRPWRDQYVTAAARRLTACRLLLPGDIFAERFQAPVLQQLESEHSQDISVNDCFKPLRTTDQPAGAADHRAARGDARADLARRNRRGDACAPQDVQTWAYDYPVELFERRVWHIPQPAGRRAASRSGVIRQSRQPLIVAGGGVLYSEATDILRQFVERTGIPVAETQAGKGSMPYDHPGALGDCSTGTEGANILAREADLVIGTARDTATSRLPRRQPSSIWTRHIIINGGVRRYKHSDPAGGRARHAEELLPLLKWVVSPAYRAGGGV